MSRKSGIALSLFGVAFVTRKLFSTPPGSESFFALLILLVLYVAAAIYHFIKRNEPVKSFNYKPQTYFIIGFTTVITAIALLIL